MLFGCTGKSYNCDHANVDCSGGGANEAEWESPDEPSSTDPSNPAVTPREGSWFLRSPSSSRMAVSSTVTMMTDDSDEEDGTIAELSKIEGSAYLLSIDPEEGFEFSCVLSGSELECDVFTMQQEYSPNLRLVQEFTLSAAFLSENEMTATILLSYECVGDDCESIVEETKPTCRVSLLAALTPIT